MLREVSQHETLCIQTLQIILGIGCIDPPPPNDPEMTHNYTSNTFVQVGDFIMYQCDSGYFLEDEETLDHFSIECLSDGTWSPMSTKTCMHPSGF